MNREFRFALAILSVCLFAHVSAAGEPPKGASWVIAAPAELTLGAKCRITTKSEGRSSRWYEGTVKAIDKQQITIVAERLQVTWTSKPVTYPVFGSPIDLGWQSSEERKLNNQEITIATDKIDRIRLLQGLISKKASKH